MTTYIKNVLEYFQNNPVVLILVSILGILVFVKTFLETSTSLLSFLPKKETFPYFDKDDNLVFKSGVVRFTNLEKQNDYLYSLRIETGDNVLGVVSEYHFISSYFQGAKILSQTLLGKTHEGEFTWMAGINEQYPEGINIQVNPEDSSIVSFFDLIKIEYMTEIHWVLFDITRFHKPNKPIDIKTAMKKFR